MPGSCHDKLNVPSTGPAYDRSYGRPQDLQSMIDMFGLAVSHGLLMLAAWRLLARPDLDSDDPAASAGGGWAALRRSNGVDEAGA